LLLAAALVAGLAAWGLAQGVRWPAGLLGLLLQNGLGATVAIAIYGLLASLAGVPEARDLLALLRRRRPAQGG
jgi:putative peptidoglycan lipid II flippase